MNFPKHKSHVCCIAGVSLRFMIETNKNKLTQTTNKYVVVALLAFRFFMIETNKQLDPPKPSRHMVVGNTPFCNTKECFSFLRFCQFLQPTDPISTRILQAAKGESDEERRKNREERDPPEAQSSDQKAKDYL